MDGLMELDDPWDENDDQELEAEIIWAHHAFGADLYGTIPEEELDGPLLNHLKETPDSAPPCSRTASRSDSQTCPYGTSSPLLRRIPG